MKTRFKKLRRRLAASAIITPLLCYLGFVILAAGSGWGCLAALLPAAVIHLSFPLRTIASGTKDETTLPYPASGWLSNLALLLFLNWLYRLPEFRKFMDSLMGGALWDWKVHTAALLWTVLGIVRNRRFANLITDRMIFDYFDRERQRREEEAGNPERW